MSGSLPSNRLLALHLVTSASDCIAVGQQGEIKFPVGEKEPEELRIY